MNKEMFDRHNSANKDLELAEILNRITTRLIMEHADKEQLLVNWQENDMKQQRLLQLAKAKGYSGTSVESVLEAAINAAPDISGEAAPENEVEFTPVAVAPDNVGAINPTDVPVVSSGPDTDS